MFSMRISWVVLLTTVAFCQTEGLTERVRQAFAGTGDAEIAIQELSRKDFASLEDLLKKRATADSPSRAGLTALRGAVAFIAGDMKAAVQAFDAAAELAPLSDGDNFTLAMALVNLEDDRRAASILSSLADSHPRDSIYVYWLGRLDYNLRRYPEAVNKLEKASQLDPVSSRVWDSLGLAFDMQGESLRAYEAFKKAVDFNRELPRPSAWPPHNLGYLCQRINKLNEAETMLRESLRFDPQLAIAHYHLGRVLEGEEQKEEAIAEYKAAISEDKSSLDACYSLAMLYRRLHREDEAGAMFAEYKRRKEQR